jgi:hypothetical protein
LHKDLPFKWNDDEKYDIVNPFGNIRQIQYHALWTFDIGNDVLRYTNLDVCRQISLAFLRERVVSLDDMKPLGGPVPPPAEPDFDSETLLWRPQAKVDDRVCAFTRRLLSDFHQQWRHILRNDYNSVTLRVLA